jgi:hypothetical protein
MYVAAINQRIKRAKQESNFDEVNFWLLIKASLSSSIEPSTLKALWVENELIFSQIKLDLEKELVFSIENIKVLEETKNKCLVEGLHRTNLLLSSPQKIVSNQSLYDSLDTELNREEKEKHFLECIIKNTEHLKT